MNAFLKAVHCLALCLFLGGPFFWMCIWRVLDTSEGRQLTPHVWQRVRFGTRLGAIVFVVSGYADLLRVVRQVSNPMDLAVLWQFLVGTRYGNMTLLKSLLIPSVLASFSLLRMVISSGGSHMAFPAPRCLPGRSSYRKRSAG